MTMLAHRFWTALALFAVFVSQVGDPKNWVLEHKMRANPTFPRFSLSPPPF